MRKPRLFNVEKALPRMSWSAENLYNLWSRSLGPHYSNQKPKNRTQFTNTDQRLFRQRWQSKKLVRAYHGDMIPEKKFTKWWLPERLPDPMVRQRAQVVTAEEVLGGPSSAKDASVDGTRKSKQEKLKAAIQTNAVAERAAQWARPGPASSSSPGAEHPEGLAPISSLMFAEVERRIDIVVFRSCFANSIYSARQLVVHGKVKLNGIKESDPNVRLNPGDMISVDPEAMTILRPPPQYVAEEQQRKQELETLRTEWEAAVAKAEGEGQEPPAKPEALEINSSQSTSENPDDPAFILPPYAAPFIFIPPYIEPSFATCSAIYLRHPTARPGYSEIPTPYDADGDIVRFAWEWYQTHRPRIRGRKRDLRERMEKGRSGWNGI